METIGDAYMVVGGLPLPSKTHAIRIAEFGLSQLEAVKTLKSPDTQEPITVRELETYIGTRRYIMLTVRVIE